MPMKRLYQPILYLFIAAGLTLGACRTASYAPQQQVVYTYTAVRLPERAPNRLDTFLDAYRQGKDSVMNVVIGSTAVPLTKTQPESTMGNFMADAQLRYAKGRDAQVAASVLNYGGMRIPYLAPGPVTVGNIYEMMPFDNTLVIAEVPGSTVREMCRLIADKKGWPVAGITFVIANDRSVKDIRIDGRDIHDNIIYKIAISDYLANGGDDCEFFRKCKRKFYNVFIRDILIEYVQEHKNINPVLTQRISYE